MPNTNDLYRRGLSSDNETERNNAILKALLYTRVLVPVEPDKIVTTRYENMFGPCDFIDRIDVAEPGTYAIIRIGGNDDE